MHLEMFNIVIALRTWGSYWCHSTNTVNCDNLGVVFVVKTSKTKDPFLAWLVLETYGSYQLAMILICRYRIYLGVIMS